MATEGQVAPAPIAEVHIPVVEKSPVDIKTGEISQEEPLPFDPAALKEKYLAERDKRLARDQGVEQYIELDGRFSKYLTDPWVEPGFKRDPIEEETEVIIVGGGYGAQVVAVRLMEQGVDNFKIIEKAGDFGGTWYWNKYPGAQCDVESYIYMPLLEEVGYMPTEKYAHAKELLAHSRAIGEKFDLYSRALFQTEVKDLRWNEEEGKWTAQTSRGDKIKSRFVIPVAGPLHRPKLPGLNGIEEFRGHSFHSSRWDYGYTGGDSTGHLHRLKDKRVGIIGTGATAVQIVPHLGEWTKELYVFQRTPSSVDVRRNRPTDREWAKSLEKGWQKKRMDNFDNIVNGGFEKHDMVADSWTDIIRELYSARFDPNNPVEVAANRQLADFKKMEQIRARTDEIVKDKETADALKPWYNQFCKRPCFHDEYLQTFNRPNVKLVDTKGLGIDRITEKGVVANGEEYEIDCLIYATGFELANDWAHRAGMEIYGRNGLRTTEKWKEGAMTLHGWGSRQFPNCFWVQVTQAAVTPNFMHITNEQAIHLAYVVSECRKRNIKTIEPTQEAEEDWTDIIVKGFALKGDYSKECTPGYYNNEGKPSKTTARNAMNAISSPAFIKILTDWRAADDLAGLDVKYFPKHGEQSVSQSTNGTESKAPPENITQVETNHRPEASSEPETYTQDEERSLVEQYSDLQAKHQAELNDLVSHQKNEVESLLGKHSRKDSGANVVDTIH
ncbi:FAD/NAD(P)-binding domain-containing protein [Cucurbitaria berberidis CBS 394.84]|uniref:FAD/NAD(P)-binding domain-containing protein n=1 Tax=Cucurbitaria berberidis CBS 394.84 TaxID=1168544 RepID=A0A9P4GFM2_9PLEO|nr:FAD/NAD(P)-binding domain-containing protein [Cucurbitaria berberidis CBS 394.84]KAF1844559.1 FAD/NAD(P)-binding domain-containing protein [Cucurbitaria berberidis CBS 394.84]